MKKILLGALAVALVTVLGCKEPDSGSGTNQPPATKQSSAALNFIKIGDIQAIGESGGATIEQATGQDLELSTNDTTNATVTASLPATSNRATVKYVLVVKANAATKPTADQFTTTNTFATLADGDIIYVQVTSEDGSTTRYYRFPITVGRNARLLSFTLGTTAQTDEAYLGIPAARDADDTLKDVDPGSFQTDQPTAEGVKVVATPQDSGATVTWGKGTYVTTPTVVITEPDPYGTTTPLKFEEDDYLFVKVVSQNGQVTLFYIFEIITPVSGKIYYGVPKMSLGETDPIWSKTGPGSTPDIETYDISRVNRAEGEYTNNPWFAEEWGQHTKATAKALWDDRGIWVLAEIDFVSPYQTGTKDANGDWTKSGNNTRTVFLGSNEHTNDSLEIFVNERLAAMQAGNGGNVTGNRDWGNQFRIGADGATSGDNTAIPDPGAPAAPNNGTNLFKDSGQYRAWLKDNNEGYYVLAHVPFVFAPDGQGGATGIGQAAPMWETVGGKKQIKAGAQMGFELQVNACAERNGTGGRDGILTWNGVTSQAYKNAWSYGLVTLEMVPGRDRVEKVADAPRITTQPKAAEYTTGEYTTVADLTVAAELPATSPTGTLSYQWYTATTSTGTGTVIPSATTASYTPPTKTPTADNSSITDFYWVVVTNTDTTADEGYRTASITSTKVSVTFALPKDLGPYAGETVRLGSGGYALFKFVLPPGKTWNDYASITVDYMVDEVNLAKGIRNVRLMGNYPLSMIPLTKDGAGRLFINLNTQTNNEMILDNQTRGWATMNNGGQVVANQWFTVTYDISGTSANVPGTGDKNKPADADTGPFWFGVGISGNDSNDKVDAIVQSIRNVTLVGNVAADNVVSKGSGYEEPLVITNETRDNAGGGNVTTRWIHYFNDWGKAGLLSETVTLGNGAYAIYKFELPKGFTWADFDAIKVNYKVDAANMLKEVRQNNTVRLLGNYANSIISGIPVNGGGLKFTNLSNELNAPYILYNGLTLAPADPGDPDADPDPIPPTPAETAWNVLNGWVQTSAGITKGTQVVADQWFTVTYPIDGTNAHGSFVAANKPAGTATGPFYFALGIPGADQNAAGGEIVQMISSVMLVGKTGKPDVLSEGSGFEEPVILGNQDREYGASGVAVSNRVPTWKFSDN
jgi:hypothetical protein